MPIIIDTLQNAVQSTLATFLQHRLSTNDDLHSDVYRTIRDVANLLLEKQLVCEAFDKDPFELMSRRHDLEDDEVGHDDGNSIGRGIGVGGSKQGNHGIGDDDNNDDIDDDALERKKNAELISRVKASLHVVSCTRISTPDGYSSIHAVIQFNNDDVDENNNNMMSMQGVKDNVRLHFKFAREPQQHIKNDDDEDVEVCLADSEDNVPETYDGYDGHRRDGSSDNDVRPERPQDEYTTCKKRKRAVNDSSPSINDKGSTKDVIENNNCDSGDCGAPMDTIRNKPHTPKTIITYTIDYSVDFGKMERLLGVDIYALDEHPSLEEAIPLLSEEEEEQNEEVEDNDSEKGDESVVQRKNNIASRNDAEYEEVDMSDDEDDDSPPIENKNSPSCGGDRFGVYIHPENVVAFLDRTNLNLNDRSVFYFLLTFPFYEHEWDIPGFVCGALFDDDDDDDDDNDEEDIQDQICCLPCN